MKRSLGRLFQFDDSIAMKFAGQDDVKAEAVLAGMNTKKRRSASDDVQGRLLFFHGVWADLAKRGCEGFVGLGRGGIGGEEQWHGGFHGFIISRNAGIPAPALRSGWT